MAVIKVAVFASTLIMTEKVKITAHLLRSSDSWNFLIKITNNSLSLALCGIAP